MKEKMTYTIKVKPTFLQAFVGWNLSMYLNYRKLIILWLYFLIATYYFMVTGNFKILLNWNSGLRINLFFPSLILIATGITLVLNELIFFIKVIFYNKSIFSEIKVILNEETIKTIRDEYELSIRYDSIKDMKVIGDYLFLIPKKPIRYGWIPISSLGEYKKDILTLMEKNIKKANGK